MIFSHILDVLDILRYARKKGINMRNINKLKIFNDDDETVNTTWDSLKYVPFAGEQNKVPDIRAELKERIGELNRKKLKKPISIRDFMMILLDTIQPCLVKSNDSDLYGDYDFWKEALGSIRPILEGFWAECDPMIISYLFMVFVSQFLVLLRLWSKIDFAIYCIKDCAVLGEFCFGISAIQNDMILSTMEKWHIYNNGEPQFIFE